MNHFNWLEGKAVYKLHLILTSNGDLAWQSHQSENACRTTRITRRGYFFLDSENEVFSVLLTGGLILIIFDKTQSCALDITWVFGSENGR